MKIILLDVENKLEDTLATAKLEMDNAYSKAVSLTKRNKIKRFLGLIVEVFLVFAIWGGFLFEVKMMKAHQDPMGGPMLLALLVMIAFSALAVVTAVYLRDLICDVEYDHSYSVAAEKFERIQLSLKNYTLLNASPHILTAEYSLESMKFTYEDSTGDVLYLSDKGFSNILNTQINEILIDYADMKIRSPYPTPEEEIT